MSKRQVLAEKIRQLTDDINSCGSEVESEQEAARWLEKFDEPHDASFALGAFFAPPKPRLAEKALHGLAGDFVRVVAPHSEADPVALLMQFLAAYGNAIGSAPHFAVEADRHRGNLFAAIVGKSSRSRKGTSQGHVRRLFEHVDPYWSEDRNQSGLSSGEGLIKAVRDPVEKHGEIVDEGVTDKRLHIVEGEFASCLKVMNRDGNILSAVLRSAWDGRPLRTLTKHSPLRATGAHISIVGHITEADLGRYLNETESANGFGNRFLWVWVERSKCLPEGGNLANKDLEGLVRELVAAVSFGRSTGEVKRDSEAREVWANVYPKLTEDRSGLMGALIARAEAQVTRLSLIYALLDRSERITRRHLEAALALWDYCEASASFIFGDQLGDPVADDILEALRRAGEQGLTRTAISQHLGRHKTRGEIARALGRLSEAGLTSFETIPTGGRSREVWKAKEANRAKEVLGEMAR